MNKIRNFMKSHKVCIMIELFTLVLITVICASLYTQQYYKNRENFKNQLTTIENEIKALEYTDAAHYLLSVYSCLSDLKCYIDNKQYCAVAFESSDMYNNVILSSKDTPVLLYLGYWHNEKLVLPLTDYFTEAELEEFYNFLYSETTLFKNWRILNLNASNITGYFDQSERFVPLSIEQIHPDSDKTFTIDNEKLIAEKSDSLFTIDYDSLGTVNPLDDEELPKGAYLALSQFYFIDSTDNSQIKAWEYFENKKMSSSEVGFHLSLNGLETDGELYVYVDTADYTLHMPSFIKNCLLVFMFLQFVAVTLILLYTYRSKQERESTEMKALFLNAMAHEMKTPIAVTINCIDCIRNNVNPTKNDHYLSIINDESFHLNSLLESMLSYTRFTDSGYSLRRTHLSLTNEIKETVSHFKTLIEQKNINVEYDIKSDFSIHADRNLISMVLDNYISNAIKNCTQNQNIIIRIHGNRFSVYNDGARIPKEHIKRIWSPLYKADESRQADNGSSGMGLAISAEILKLHNLDYGVTNLSEGVEFYIKTPSGKSTLKKLFKI